MAGCLESFSLQLQALVLPCGHLLCEPDAKYIQEDVVRRTILGQARTWRDGDEETPIAQCPTCSQPFEYGGPESNTMKVSVTPNRQLGTGSIIALDSSEQFWRLLTARLGAVHVGDAVAEEMIRTLGIFRGWTQGLQVLNDAATQTTAIHFNEILDFLDYHMKNPIDLAEQIRQADASMGETDSTVEFIRLFDMMTSKILQAKNQVRGAHVDLAVARRRDFEDPDAENLTLVTALSGESNSEGEGDNDSDEDVSDEDVGDGEDDGGDEGQVLSRSNDGERNSQLTVGHKHDRTFVTRGDKISIFKHTDEGVVEHAATIKNLRFKKMKTFRPKKTMLHDHDSKLVLMNPNERQSLFSMDIECGKVVEEWKVPTGVTIDHIAPKDKFAQMTGEQTLVGLSNNTLFRIDPRVGGRGGDAMAENKQYSANPMFSGVTTTGSGQLAVGSQKGEIKLFDTVGKIAKTALPAMGDPIIEIDVTADGRWILGTCKNYLFLVDTLIEEGKNSGSFGFDKPFPAHAKPRPIRLQLKAEHEAYLDRNISFTPARFNMGEGQEENAIVTSTGRYVIVWDFPEVKKGKLESYVIKRYEDNVVQDNFRFGDDKEIIVALPNDVLAINKKELKKLVPRRSLTLTAPRTPPRSTSTVVNSPW